MGPKFKSAATMLIFISFCLISQAQYPTIPPAMQDSTDQALTKVKNKSDEAWRKALPFIEAESKMGKPYIPWARKPEDLPQAKIPAFPGAEGGGAYSFGGRGGKVIVVTNLDDSGPGSFRAACEEGGARIVVFKKPCEYPGAVYHHCRTNCAW